MCQFCVKKLKIAFFHPPKKGNYKIWKNININTLYDNEEESEKAILEARKPYGNITIANCDANWDAYAHVAIEQAMRAVEELG